MTIYTLNPSDKSANIALTNGNLTATPIGSTAAFDGVRQTGGLLASGKWYAEMQYTGAGAGSVAVQFAVLDATAPLTSTFAGVDTHGVGYGYAGSTFYNNAFSTFGVYNTANAFADLAVDGSNGKIWTRGTNGLWNNDILANQNPATNTGGFSCSGVFTAGTIYFAVFSDGPTASCVMNFGATTPSRAAPSGFIMPNDIGAALSGFFCAA